MVKLKRRRRKKRDCDTNCNFHQCDGGPGCDCSLFYTLLTAGSVAAQVVPARVADSAGRAAIVGYRRWLSHRWPGECRFRSHL